MVNAMYHFTLALASLLVMIFVPLMHDPWLVWPFAITVSCVHETEKQLIQPGGHHGRGGMGGLENVWPSRLQLSLPIMQELSIAE